MSSSSPSPFSVPLPPPFPLTFSLPPILSSLHSLSTHLLSSTSSLSPLSPILTRYIATLIPLFSTSPPPSPSSLADPNSTFISLSRQLQHDLVSQITSENVPLSPSLFLPSPLFSLLFSLFGSLFLFLSADVKPPRHRHHRMVILSLFHVIFSICHDEFHSLVESVVESFGRNDANYECVVVLMDFFLESLGPPASSSLYINSASPSSSSPNVAPSSCFSSLLSTKYFTPILSLFNSILQMISSRASSPSSPSSSSSSSSSSLSSVLEMSPEFKKLFFKLSFFYLTRKEVKNHMIHILLTDQSTSNTTQSDRLSLHSYFHSLCCYLPYETQKEFFLSLTLHLVSMMSTWGNSNGECNGNVTVEVGEDGMAIIWKMILVKEEKEDIEAKIAQCVQSQAFTLTEMVKYVKSIRGVISQSLLLYSDPSLSIPSPSSSSSSPCTSSPIKSNSDDNEFPPLLPPFRLLFLKSLITYVSTSIMITPFPSPSPSSPHLLSFIFSYCLKFTNWSEQFGLLHCAQLLGTVMEKVEVTINEERGEKKRRHVVREEKAIGESMEGGSGNKIEKLKGKKSRKKEKEREKERGKEKDNDTNTSIATPNHPVETILSHDIHENAPPPSPTVSLLVSFLSHSLPPLWNFIISNLDQPIKSAIPVVRDILKTFLRLKKIIIIQKIQEEKENNNNNQSDDESSVDRIVWHDICSMVLPLSISSLPSSSLSSHLTRSKLYELLILIREISRIHHLLSHCPSLVESLFSLCDDRTKFTTASNIIIGIIVRVEEEEEDQGFWHTEWLRVLLPHVYSFHPVVIDNISSCILADLFSHAKYGKLWYGKMVSLMEKEKDKENNRKNSLTSDTPNSEESLWGFAMCALTVMKIARRVGIVTTQQIQNQWEKEWKKEELETGESKEKSLPLPLSYPTFLSCLLSRSPSLSLSSFEFLTSSLQTHTPPSPLEFSLFPLYPLTSSFAFLSFEGKSKFVLCCKRFLERIGTGEGGKKSEREKGKEKGKGEGDHNGAFVSSTSPSLPLFSPTLSDDFLISFLSSLLHQTLLSRHVDLVIINLELIKIILNQFLSSSSSSAAGEMKQFGKFSLWISSRQPFVLLTLMKCLESSWEKIRNVAFDIIFSLPRYIFDGFHDDIDNDTNQSIPYYFRYFRPSLHFLSGPKVRQYDSASKTVAIIFLKMMRIEHRDKAIGELRERLGETEKLMDKEISRGNNEIRGNNGLSDSDSLRMDILNELFSLIMTSVKDKSSASSPSLSSSPHPSSLHGMLSTLSLCIRHSPSSLTSSPPFISLLKNLLYHYISYVRNEAEHRVKVPKTAEEARGIEEKERGGVGEEAETEEGEEGEVEGEAEGVEAEDDDVIDIASDSAPQYDSRGHMYFPSKDAKQPPSSSSSSHTIANVPPPPSTSPVDTPYLQYFNVIRWLQLKETINLIESILPFTISSAHLKSEDFSYCIEFLLFMLSNSKHIGVLDRTAQVLRGITMKVYQQAFYPIALQSSSTLSSLSSGNNILSRPDDSLSSKWYWQYLESCLLTLLHRVESSNSPLDFTWIRRSRGLVFSFLSLLHADGEYAEKKREETKMAKRVMGRLVEILKEKCDRWQGKGDAPAEDWKVIVNSLNLLRSFIRHPTLSTLLLSHISTLLTLSLSLFSHSHWVVNNSSLLLFGAIKTKMTKNALKGYKISGGWFWSLFGDMGTTVEKMRRKEERRGKLKGNDNNSENNDHLSLPPLPSNNDSSLAALLILLSSVDSSLSSLPPPLFRSLQNSLLLFLGHREYSIRSFAATAVLPFRQYEEEGKGRKMGKSIEIVREEIQNAKVSVPTVTSSPSSPVREWNEFHGKIQFLLSYLQSFPLSQSEDPSIRHSIVEELLNFVLSLLDSPPSPPPIIFSSVIHLCFIAFTGQPEGIKSREIMGCKGDYEQKVFDTFIKQIMTIIMRGLTPSPNISSSSSSSLSLFNPVGLPLLRELCFSSLIRLYFFFPLRVSSHLSSSFSHLLFYLLSRNDRFDGDFSYFLSLELSTLLPLISLDGILSYDDDILQWMGSFLIRDILYEKKDKDETSHTLSLRHKGIRMNVAVALLEKVFMVMEKSQGENIPWHEKTRRILSVFGLYPTASNNTPLSTDDFIGFAAFIHETITSPSYSSPSHPMGRFLSYSLQFLSLLCSLSPPSSSLATSLLPIVLRSIAFVYRSPLNQLEEYRVQSFAALAFLSPHLLFQRDHSHHLSSSSSSSSLPLLWWSLIYEGITDDCRIIRDMSLERAAAMEVFERKSNNQKSDGQSNDNVTPLKVMNYNYVVTKLRCAHKMTLEALTLLHSHSHHSEVQNVFMNLVKSLVVKFSMAKENSQSEINDNLKGQKQKGNLIPINHNNINVGDGDTVSPACSSSPSTSSYFKSFLFDFETTNHSFDLSFEMEIFITKTLQTLMTTTPHHFLSFCGDFIDHLTAVAEFYSSKILQIAFCRIVVLLCKYHYNSNPNTEKENRSTHMNLIIPTVLFRLQQGNSPLLSGWGEFEGILGKISQCIQTKSCEDLPNIPDVFVQKDAVEMQ